MRKAIIYRNESGKYNFVIARSTIAGVEEILCSSKQGYERKRDAIRSLYAVTWCDSLTQMTFPEYRAWRRMNLKLKRQVEARRKRK